eukprot:GAHX01009622.1.p1 GENE.GAHX01009622.1~~GAHX01009622.1.p1  ORF type:complete len:57 (-),score=5.46 GAHX01009622.1:46-216(-)
MFSMNKSINIDNVVIEKVEKKSQFKFLSFKVYPFLIFSQLFTQNYLMIVILIFLFI